MCIELRGRNPVFTANFPNPSFYIPGGQTFTVLLRKTTTKVSIFGLCSPALVFPAHGPSPGLHLNRSPAFWVMTCHKSAEAPLLGDCASASSFGRFPWQLICKAWVWPHAERTEDGFVSRVIKCNYISAVPPPAMSCGSDAWILGGGGEISGFN